MIKIYALSNPITNEVFYIGCTSVSLEDRLKAHYLKLSEVKRNAINWNKRLEYLNNLLPNKAVIILLDECEVEVKNEVEKMYIKKFKELNPNLCNQTIGGIGGNTYTNLSDVQKIKTSNKISKALTGRKKPEGFSEQLSQKRKGINNPQAGKLKNPFVCCESDSEIIVFKSSYEAINYFNSKYCWGQLVSNAKYNRLKNKLIRKFQKKYFCYFITEINNEFKDIVQSYCENSKCSYVLNKHTKEITTI